MSTLFDLESLKQDSPRLAWMKKHDIKTHCWTDDPDELPWLCWSGELPSDPASCASGKTEDEALACWARWNGVRFWNEGG